ncbi:MAG TPA: endonuclease/exonuclease/phosphatase family protein [Pyrinomonadaceae bacterium]|jgi:endonuclease/exonuclease/phosphatase family metal-dependent hydrolase|nr:endonuclease/exonuclease/phosphatase family protein [Pyrinomonadaceae bacterium]
MNVIEFRSGKWKAAVGGALAVLLLAGVYALAQPRERTRKDAPEKLLEVGTPSKSVGGGGRTPSEIKVVSYNIRYRAGEELEQLIGLLRSDPEIGGASIIGLQEVDRNRKRTGNVNTARRLADALGMNYAWAAPPSAEGGEEETGVAVLSPYPLRDVTRLLLPHEGPGSRRRVALGATVRIGETDVRVYSVHAETRMPLEKKVAHWRAVIEDLAHHKAVAHTVVLGDFNTIKGKDVRAARRLFSEAGFETPFPDDRSTWKTFVVKLKLDWLWLRGMKPVSFGIDRDVEFSDHWPLWATVKLETKPAAADTDER